MEYLVNLSDTLLLGRHLLVYYNILPLLSNNLGFDKQATKTHTIGPYHNSNKAFTA